MTFPFGHTVTLLRRTKTGIDTHGNDVFTAVPDELCELCAVWPVSTEGRSEQLDGRDVVTDRRQVAVPAGTDVSAIDGVLIDGLEFEVDGPVDDYTSPFTGWAPGLIIHAKRVTG